MAEDVVRSFGLLTLGSRMRRIGERLQADTQRILDELEVPVQPSQYPFLAALDREGPLTIGELAEAVGMTQPGVTRAIALLSELGLVKAKQEAEDQRRRIVSLTRDGERVVATAKRAVWPRIERAVADLCDGFAAPLLRNLALIEDRLEERPLHRRSVSAKTGA
jgi:DNA-binding MarR family transcriptional regulator